MNFEFDKAATSNFENLPTVTIEDPGRQRFNVLMCLGGNQNDILRWVVLWY